MVNKIVNAFPSFGQFHIGALTPWDFPDLDIESLYEDLSAFSTTDFITITYEESFELDDPVIIKFFNKSDNNFQDNHKLFYSTDLVTGNGWVDVSNPDGATSIVYVGSNKISIEIYKINQKEYIALIDPIGDSYIDEKEYDNELKRIKRRKFKTTNVSQNINTTTLHEFEITMLKALSELNIKAGKELLDIHKETFKALIANKRPDIIFDTNYSTTNLHIKSERLMEYIFDYPASYTPSLHPLREPTNNLLDRQFKTSK